MFGSIMTIVAYGGLIAMVVVGSIVIASVVAGAGGHFGIVMGPAIAMVVLGLVFFILTLVYTINNWVQG